MTAAGTPIPRRKRIPDLQILQAASHEFAAAGYHGARVDQIAHDAQITKRTLYVRFESKDQLFRAALLYEAQELSRRLLTAYTSDSHELFRERLHRYVHAYFAFAAERPDGFKLLFLNEDAAYELDVRRTIATRIAQLTAEALGEQRVTDQHCLIASMIVAATHDGAGTAVLNGMKIETAAGITEQFLAAALQGLEPLPG